MQEAKRAAASEAALQAAKHTQAVRSLDARIAALEQQLAARDTRITELHAHCDGAMAHAAAAEREAGRLRSEAGESRVRLEELGRLQASLAALRLFLTSLPQAEPGQEDLAEMRDDGRGAARAQLSTVW